MLKGDEQRKSNKEHEKEKMKVAVPMCIALESEKTSFKISTVEHIQCTTQKSVVKRYMEPIIVKEVSAHVLNTGHHWMLYLLHVTSHPFTI